MILRLSSTHRTVPHRAALRLAHRRLIHRRRRLLLGALECCAPAVERLELRRELVDLRLLAAELVDRAAQLRDALLAIGELPDVTLVPRFLLFEFLFGFFFYIFQL